MSFADLHALPESVVQASAALEALDEAFLGGFGRLSSRNLEALASLQRSFAATPLAEAFAEAIAGIGRSEFLDRHFLVLAAARSAVHGAIHDALIDQASAALGRPTPALGEGAVSPSQAAPPQVAVLLESARQWLMEIALAGFANLEVDILLPFQATLDVIEEEPLLARQAALLGGLLGEFLAVFPCRGTPEIPRLRWADLWTRAMILAAAAPEPIASREVSGELRILGADLRQHDTFATLAVYGALHEAGGKAPLLCRASVSAFKVDVIQGVELGPLFAEVGKVLLEGLAAGGRLLLTGMRLLATGDLLWDEAKAEMIAKADPIAEAAALLGAGAPALRPTLAPADRHPALIDELIYLADGTYTLGTKGEPALVIDGQAIPLAVERWPDDAGLALADLAGSKGIVGLLRVDGGAWSIQPLTISKGKAAPRMLAAEIAGGVGKKSSSSSLATLKERAGKLLRKTGRR